MKKAAVVIPVSDIAGVGPEIMVRAMGHPEVYEWCRPTVVRGLSAMERAVSVTESKAKIRYVEHPGEVDAEFGILDSIDLKNVDASKIESGKVQRDAGQAVFEFIEKPVEPLEGGEADAIATTAINKEVLKAAGIHYIGHTEIIGGLPGVEDPMIMFQVQSLRVFFLSRHLPLQQATEFMMEEHVHRHIKRVHQGMQNLGTKNPWLVIAGLNPHSGEHGLSGWEEVREMTPATERARAGGINIKRPIEVDPVFYLALKGDFDTVTSPYHDQGHITTKMVDLERTISVTVEMSHTHTLVDHGTVLDIVGKNLASEASMCEATRLTVEYSVTYKSGICWVKEERRRGIET